MDNVDKGTSQVAQWVKNHASAGGTGDAALIPGLGRSPGGGNGNPEEMAGPVFLPGESHGQRSLVGYSQ